jgi:hypothetical protein
MNDTVWNADISTFYVGYLIGQLPGNLLMAKSNPRWFLPAAMFMWSTGTIYMPAMTRYVLLGRAGWDQLLIKFASGAGFCVVRFFIGLTEAPFFPALTLCKTWTSIQPEIL